MANRIYVAFVASISDVLQFWLIYFESATGAQSKLFILVLTRTRNIADQFIQRIKVAKRYK